MAVERDYNVWTEFLGGRLVFRVDTGGRIITFNGDKDLKNWVLAQ